MAEAIVRLFSTIWAALRARTMAKASADLPRGEQINQGMAADVAELERQGAPKDTGP